jgi:hypothetical protein
MLIALLQLKPRVCESLEILHFRLQIVRRIFIQ